jgi:hypothetical protein
MIAVGIGHFECDVVGLLESAAVVEDDAVGGVYTAQLGGAGEVFVRVVKFAAAVGDHGTGGLIERERRRVFLVLPQHAQVIKNPEGAARRGRDEVALVHAQVGDRRDRQIQLKRRPVFAAVPRDKDAALGAGKQQVFAHVIFAHDARERVGGNAVVDLRPRRAVVGGLVETGRVIVELVSRGGDVGRALIERRHFDRVDQTLREALGRHVLPCGAAVARQLHKPSSLNQITPFSCGDSTM